MSEYVDDLSDEVKAVAEKVYTYIKDNDNVLSFVNIKEFLRDVCKVDIDGERVVCNKVETVIYWTGMSDIFADIITYLVVENRINLITVRPSIYNGEGLSLPLATEANHKETLCWIPVVFKIED